MLRAGGCSGGTNLSEQLSATRGERDADRPAVGVVRRPFDQAAFFKSVDYLGRRARRDAESFSHRAEPWTAEVAHDLQRACVVGR
jgi:hypothetical protein